jgi:hypothetical protein
LQVARASAAAAAAEAADAVLAIQWTKKPPDAWSAVVGPFVVKIEPKGDGRWSWRVFKGAQANPMAAGIARSLGAAKAVVEHFVNRSA